MRLWPLLFVAGSLFAGTAAVLPFANRTSQANMDWIGESIAETVRDALGPRGVVTLSREEVEEAYRQMTSSGHFTPHTRKDITDWLPPA